MARKSRRAKPARAARWAASARPRQQRANLSERKPASQLSASTVTTSLKWSAPQFTSLRSSPSRATSVFAMAGCGGGSRSRCSRPPLVAMCSRSFTSREPRT
eukprot:8668697-Pyramimonas_sp.AAC.1